MRTCTRCDRERPLTKFRGGHTLCIACENRSAREHAYWLKKKQEKEGSIKPDIEAAVFDPLTKHMARSPWPEVVTYTEEELA